MLSSLYEVNTPMMEHPRSHAAIKALINSYDLIRLPRQKEDFLPYMLVREEYDLHLTLIRPIMTGLGQLDFFEMGGRLGEEDVYGYMATRRTGKSGCIYLILARPNGFGKHLLEAFQSAVNHMFYLDAAQVQ